MSNYARIKALQRKYEKKEPKKYYKRKQALRSLEPELLLTKQEKKEVMNILYSITNLKELHRKASIDQLIIIIAYNIKKIYTPTYQNKRLLNKYEISDKMFIHTTRMLFNHYRKKNTNPYHNNTRRYSPLEQF